MKVIWVLGKIDPSPPPSPPPHTKKDLLPHTTEALSPSMMTSMTKTIDRYKEIFYRKQTLCLS